MPGPSSISSFGPYPEEEPIKVEEKEEKKSSKKSEGLEGAIGSVKETKIEKQTPKGRPSPTAAQTAEPKKGFFARMIDKVRTTTSRESMDGATTTEDVREAGGITKSRAPEVPAARKLLGKRVYHYKGDILPWMKNIFEAGKRGDQYVVEQFNTLIENSNHFTPEQKIDLLLLVEGLKGEKLEELDREMEEELSRPELSEDLASPLLPDEELDALHKEISESIRKTVYEHIANLGTSILRTPDLEDF